MTLDALIRQLQEIREANGGQLRCMVSNSEFSALEDISGSCLVEVDENDMQWGTFDGLLIGDLVVQIG